MWKKMMPITAALCVAAAGLGFAAGNAETAPSEMEQPESRKAIEEFASEGLGSEEISAAQAPEEEGPLTLTADEAVEYAFEHNLNLAASRIDEEIKRRKSDYAWNRFIPQVQVSGRMSRANELGETFTFDPTTGGLTTEKLPRTSVSGSLEATLQLNYAMFEAIRGTRIDLRAGRISTQQAKAELERDVRKSFYNLLLMQRNIELMKERIDAAQRRYEQAQINYENGMVPELTMLSARVSWENMKPQLRELELGYRQALQGFKMNLGLDLQREIRLQGNIEAPAIDVEAERLIDNYLTERLDIRSMVTNVENLESRLTAIKLRTFTPNVILGFNMDPAFQGDPLEESWFDGDKWSQQRGGLSLTIAMSLDGFLPWSSTQIDMREMEDNIRKTRIRLLQTIRGAEMEIRSTVRSLKKSRDSIETLQLNVERARRAYQMAEEAYNAGSRELLEVQNAEIELKNARLEVLKERYNYIKALLDLEYALNTDLEKLRGVDASTTQSMKEEEND